MGDVAEATVGAAARTEVPFDAARLDRLMDEAGIDVLLATSKHNNRYLMGGYSFLFYSAMEAHRATAATCRFWSMPRGLWTARPMSATAWSATTMR